MYNATRTGSQCVDSGGRYLVATNRSALLALIIASSLTGGVPALAQSAPPSIDSQISILVTRVAEPLQKANETRVVVADLSGPEGQPHRLGKYLAERLTESLQREFPSLEVIDRSGQEAHDDGEPGNKATGLEKTKDWARKLGANVVITGRFWKLSQEIWVLISVMFCNDSRSWIDFTDGYIPITDEIASLSQDLVPSPQRIRRPGIGGATIPECVYCPHPKYTPEAAAAKYEGAFVLEVVVNLEGRAEQIVVVKGRDYGLENSAVETVKEWKFKPAVGPDGNPVAVILLLEITFRLTPPPEAHL
jgi:TonB family protein